MLSCGGTPNSAFGTPQDAGEFDTTIAGCTCNRGFCCGSLCCASTDTCCMNNGVPSCVGGTQTSCTSNTVGTVNP